MSLIEMSATNRYIYIYIYAQYNTNYSFLNFLNDSTILVTNKIESHLAYLEKRWVFVTEIICNDLIINITVIVCIKYTITIILIIGSLYKFGRYTILTNIHLSLKYAKCDSIS